MLTTTPNSLKSLLLALVASASMLAFAVAPAADARAAVPAVASAEQVAGR